MSFSVFVYLLTRYAPIRRGPATIAYPNADMSHIIVIVALSLLACLCDGTSHVSAAAISKPLSLSGQAVRWKENPTGPIYNPFPGGIDEDYFPNTHYDEDLFDHTTDAPYQMWHQSGTGLIGLSRSLDGISWTFVGQTSLTSAYHACVVFDAAKFGGSGFYYRILYWTGSAAVTPFSIRFAESNDGLTWSNDQAVTQNPSFPIVTGVVGTLLYHNYGPGAFYYNSDATSTPGRPWSFPYVMFYDIAKESGGTQGSSEEGIGFAYSSDAHNWTRYSTAPVIVPSGENEWNAWDGSHNFRPSVVIDDEGVYHLFCTGSNSNFADGLVYAHGIAHFASVDGTRVCP